MSLKIRFQRHGTKNAPVFRLVVAEKSNPRDGKVVEFLGFYNPKSKEYSLKLDRVDYWVSKGAQLSSSAHVQVKKAQKGTITEGVSKYNPHVKETAVA